MASHESGNSNPAGGEPDDLGFLAGDSELAALMRARDWSDSPLGPPTGWSPALRGAVAAMLSADFQIVLFWGPELVALYNDPYAPTIGDKHPRALGRPARENWAELWDDLEPMLRGVLDTGETFAAKDRPFYLERHGYPETVYFDISYSAVRGGGGAIEGVLCIVNETTERVKAVAALREREERLSLVIDGASDYAIFTVDPERRITSWSKGAEGIFGFTADEAMGMCADRLWVEEDRAAGLPQREIDTARAHGCANDERWHERSDGTRVFLNGSVHPLPPDPDGNERGFIKIARDETERRAAERALRDAGEQAAKDALQRSAILNQLAEGVVVTDPAGRITFVNEAARQLHGTAELDVGPNDYAERYQLFRIDGSPYPSAELPLAKAVSAGETAIDERWRIRRPDGSEILAIGSAQPIVAPDGERLGAVLTVRDDTRRSAMESALRESEQRFRNMADHAPVMMWVTETDASCSYLNRAWYEFTGQSEEEGLGFGWLDAVHPDDRDWSGEVFIKANEKREPFRLEYRLRRSDGGYSLAIDAGSPRFGADGTFLGYIGSVIDIEQRRVIEEALRTSETRFREVFEQASVGMAEIDGDWKILGVNEAYCKVADRAADELVGEHCLSFTHEEDLEESREIMRRASEGDGQVSLEKRYVGKDGQVTWIRSNMARVSAPGAELRLLKVVEDITDRRAAEEALHLANETLEQRVVERTDQLEVANEALRQAQKMEAIGQLTGGIAHDFNNMLTVIRGSADVLRRPNLEEEKRERYLDAIAETADRAARLTGQLLAFARRQALKPEVFDVNRRVESIADMLRTVLGSRYRLQIAADCDKCHIEADSAQFETALVNMAVNARDAMDSEGALAIRVARVKELPDNLQPQQAAAYIAISVADTGHGIREDDLAKIFEPFFTTKEVGRGTGLGLSQVYGFAKQSGGEIGVDSEIGRGTTFTLYLPEVDAQPDDERDTSGGVPRLEPGGRVLVVEDNDEVGRFAEQVLADLGQKPKRSGTADDALRLLESGERFDIVFSDVVMPGTSGIDFAREVRRRWPDLPVVLTSGYSHVLAAQSGHGFPLLQKPYSLEGLQRALAEALHG